MEESSHFEHLKAGIIRGQSLEEIHSETGTIITRRLEKPRIMELKIRYTIDPEKTENELKSGEYKTHGNWKELAKSRPDLFEIHEPKSVTEGMSSLVHNEDCKMWPYHKYKQTEALFETGQLSGQDYLDFMYQKMKRREMEEERGRAQPCQLKIFDEAVYTDLSEFARAFFEIQPSVSPIQNRLNYSRLSKDLKKALTVVRK